MNLSRVPVCNEQTDLKLKTTKQILPDRVCRGGGEGSYESHFNNPLIAIFYLNILTSTWKKVVIRKLKFFFINSSDETFIKNM